MALRYVKYIGPAHMRQITARDWALVGIQADTVVWLPQNGFAVPLDQFTDDQIRKAIDPDSYLVVTGEDEDYTPTPTQTETVTPGMLEAGRVDITDDDSREKAIQTVTEEGQRPDVDDDRSTPRTTSGGRPQGDG